MKPYLINTLLLLIGFVCYSCTTPCETQTFRFGEHTIEFPVDVTTIKSRIPDVQLIPNSYLLTKAMEDTLIRIW